MKLVRSTVVAAVGVAALATAAQAQPRPDLVAQAIQAATPTATQIFVKFTGMRQGVLKGDSRDARHHDWSVVDQVSLELVVPHSSTGGVTGRHEYNPLVVTKHIGASSPQLLSAAATNETLTRVEIEFDHVTNRGTLTPFYRIILTDASIVDVHETAGLMAGGALEDVQLIFRKIEVDSLEGGTSFVDDTLAGR